MSKQFIGIKKNSTTYKENIMLKTKQDLMKWFNNLVMSTIRQSVFTGMVNGHLPNVDEDKQNALLVLNIIQKCQ